MPVHANTQFTCIYCIYVLSVISVAFVHSDSKIHKYIHEILKIIKHACVCPQNTKKSTKKRYQNTICGHVCGVWKCLQNYQVAPYVLVIFGFVCQHCTQLLTSLYDHILIPVVSSLRLSSTCEKKQHCLQRMKEIKNNALQVTWYSFRFIRPYWNVCDKPHSCSFCTS